MPFALRYLSALPFVSGAHRRVTVKPMNSNAANISSAAERLSELNSTGNATMPNTPPSLLTVVAKPWAVPLSLVGYASAGYAYVRLVGPRLWKICIKA
ncbi:MAG: hypothetical protein QXU16_03610, partial [Candidatus Micrarchaeaceae archaeon]